MSTGPCWWLRVIWVPSLVLGKYLNRFEHHRHCFCFFWTLSLMKIQFNIICQSHTKPKEMRTTGCLCLKVAELVTSEFFEQGDRERSELKLTPAVSWQRFLLLLMEHHSFHQQWFTMISLQPIFDRNRKDELPALQLEWIDGICAPLYQVRSRAHTHIIWMLPYHGR